ncbi:MAG: ABC-F family ATP-binding cassette domain-containing protein [Caldilineales bacterium]|nr:ABC-F family ATP-binding cassette domain-containing protein [Caldilineales bacterium]
MNLITIENLSKQYSERLLFDRASLQINEGDRIGLIGVNGSGKSTLLKLIAGQVASDTGFVVRAKGLTVGYLQQEPQLEAGRTLLASVLTASEPLQRLEADLARIEERLVDPAIFADEKALARALDRQAHLLEEFEKLGGPGFEGRVRTTLRSLGFAEADFDLPVEALSGGQRKLAGLARLLVTQPDLLLLDEPDNHLDLAGKAFLEEFIRDYKGAVVIVSHDRYLLDVVADEIVELEDGKLTRYPGNYSEYTFEKETRLLRQQQLFHVQQVQVTRLEQAAQRLLTWGRTHDNEKLIKRGKAILKRIERIERIDRPVLDRRRMALKLEGWRGSDKVLELRDVDKVFPAADGNDEKIVLLGLNLLIRRDERVGLIGPNGAGKSVLFRIILGQEEATAGQVLVGPSIKIGYYAQQHETLDPNRTLIETVRLAAPRTESDAVAFLGKFLFTYQQARSPVSTLSGGERSRLQLALLTLTGPNFLMLDEPTNNLDIASAEVLEAALADFTGSALIISHDRYFLDRVVDRILALDQGIALEYPGNYSDYLSHS